MIVADTGAIIALVDADDGQHRIILDLYAADPASWVLPWAILPEVDYLLSHHVGGPAAAAFLRDVAVGAFVVEWGERDDLVRVRAARAAGGAAIDPA